MRTTAQCIYRIHEKGEILDGVFNITKGIIEQIPNMMLLNVFPMYEYTDGNYMSALTVSQHDLVNIMCKYPNALAVIEYNQIGAIVITRSSHGLYLFNQGYITKSYTFKNKQFDIPIKDVGIVKTIVLTFNYTQSVAHLIIDMSGEVPIIHTRKGNIEVEFDYSEDDASHSVRHYLEMADKPNVYATISDKGSIKFVGIIKNKMRVIGG